MHNELKKQIINFIFANLNEFQINNATKAKFGPYIYDIQGDYLIGGKDVSEFISKAIELIKK